MVGMKGKARKEQVKKMCLKEFINSTVDDLSGCK